MPLQLPQESSLLYVGTASCTTALITSSRQSFQQRRENTPGLEKEQWELVGLQRSDGFVRLGTKSHFLLGQRELRCTIPTLILAPSGHAVTG